MLAATCFVNDRDPAHLAGSVHLSGCTFILGSWLIGIRAVPFKNGESLCLFLCFQRNEVNSRDYMIPIY